VRGFYTQPEESVELFRRHRVALMFANYGSQQVKLLRDAGADVGYVLPREGALAWLDCWAITAACMRPDLAHAWLDHMLSASVGRRLSERQGLANTVEPLPTAVAEGQLVWLEPVEDEARRAALWRRIMSGERPERLR
jgi:putative spermidine/putrescine transport system substrate-binding protein